MAADIFSPRAGVRSGIFRAVVKFDFKRNDWKQRAGGGRGEKRSTGTSAHTWTEKDWERDREVGLESVVAAINKSRERPVTLSASYNSK